MPESTLESRGFIAQDPVTKEETYAVVIKIACPYCGDQQHLIAGHHLRGFRDALVQLIDARPDLCGPLKATETTRYTIEGSAGDPEQN